MALKELLKIDPDNFGFLKIKVNFKNKLQRRFFLGPHREEHLAKDPGIGE